MGIHQINDNIVASELNNIQEEALPEVCLPGNGVSISDTAEALAMAYQNASNAELRVFNHGGAICHVMEGSSGSKTLVVLEPKRACSEFEQVARLVKRKPVKGGGPEDYTTEPAVCTTSIAGQILCSRKFFNLISKINLVTNAPVILRGKNNVCRIINSYDETSGIFPTGVPAEEVPLDEAIRLLNLVVADFHYQSEGDKSRALAALLTPALVAGGILNARSPMMLLEADKSQSGKSFFSKILGAIYNETPVTVTQRERGTGGLDENFDAAVCCGRQLIVLDNLRGKLNSPQIEAFLTSERHMARMPYSPQVEVEPGRYFIMATSNNFELTVDMANRACIIRIFMQSKNYQFQSFPEGDILDHIKANQPRYLGAIFTVIREWVRLGSQRMPHAAHDFRDWCRALDWMVQNILHGAPLMDGHREVQMVTVHPEVNWLKGLYNVIRDLDELDKPMTALNLAERCELAEVELPGAMGASWQDLDERGHRQVCSQIGRRLANLYKKLGDNREVCIGNFSVTRESRRMTYASGNYENAMCYRFNPVA